MECDWGREGGGGARDTWWTCLVPHPLTAPAVDMDFNMLALYRPAVDMDQHAGSLQHPLLTWISTCWLSTAHMDFNMLEHPL